MFKRIAALCVLLLLPSLAFGADMALKAPYRAAAPACGWCGLYFGGHVGYGWARSGFSGSPLLDEVEFGALEPSGVNFGGQVGYLMQWGAFVAGAEVQATWWNAKKSADVVVGGETALTNTIKLDYTASVRAILGMEVLNGVLLYGTGGPAFGHAEGTLTVGDTALNASANHFGFEYGVGARYRMTDSLILGIEGLWQDLGKSTYSFGAGLDNNGRLQTGSVKARLDLKLN